MLHYITQHCHVILYYSTLLRYITLLNIVTLHYSTLLRYITLINIVTLCYIIQRYLKSSFLLPLLLRSVVIVSLFGGLLFVCLMFLLICLFFVVFPP